MKPLKVGTKIKVRNPRGFEVVDIKSRRKVKKKHKVKFYYIVDKYNFNNDAGVLRTEKDVETTLAYFRSLYQNNRVENKIEDVNTCLAKHLLGNNL